jgi:hypothetical protein
VNPFSKEMLKKELVQSAILGVYNTFFGYKTQSPHHEDEKGADPFKRFNKETGDL